MNKNNPDPEKLYKSYKETRTQKPSSHAVDAPVPDNTEDDLLNQTYRHYQQNRNSTATDIDNIMQAIADTSEVIVNDQPSLEEQNLSNTGKATLNHQKPHPVDNKPEQAAANDSGKLLRYFVPAIAATLIAFFVFPLISGKNNAVDPSNANAYLNPALAPFIEPNSNSILGFSDTDNDRNAALNHGFLATDLNILSEAGGPTDKVNQVLKSYLFTKHNNPEAVEKAAQKTLLGLATGENPGQLTPESLSNIQTLISELDNHNSKNSTTEWYSVGQAIESVALAAQLALSTTDTSLLGFAISHSRGLNFGDEDMNLKGQIEALFSESVNQSMANADLRRILAKANDIKSVVQ